MAVDAVGMDRLPQRLLAVVAVMLTCLLTTSSALAEQSRSASSFVESIGVDTHTSYDYTPYGADPALVKQRLIELGVHHVREDLTLDDPAQYQTLNELASAGIHSTVILGKPTDGAAGLSEMTSVLEGPLRGAVEAVEGPNEYDLHGGTDWSAEDGTYQAQIYAAIKSSPVLASLPVVGPSLGSWTSWNSVGNFSSSLDYGNLHSYPNGDTPESNLAAQMQSEKRVAGVKPVIATETGYQTSMASAPGEQMPVSEAAQATYMPRLFLDYYAAGVSRTYAYELLDEFPDPGGEQAEAGFGLLRNDLSPKPAFEAVRNMISILDDPGPEFSPGSLDYRIVDGSGSDLHQVLLQKRDGTYYLALWRDTSVWDRKARTAIEPGAAPVHIEFDRPLSNAREFRPNASASPTRELPTGRHPVTVQVGAQVVLVAVTPVEGDAGRIRLWLGRHSDGNRVALRARLPRLATGRPVPVKVQAWQGHWRTVGRGRAGGRGVFHKSIHIAGRTSASRFRVIAAVPVKPSNPVRVRLD